MSTSIKAYVVTEPEEGCVAVVFDEHNVVARRLGAARLDCEFEEVQSCVRKPEFV